MPPLNVSPSVAAMALVPLGSALGGEDPTIRPPQGGDAFRHPLVPDGLIVRFEPSRPIGGASRILFSNLIDSFPRDHKASAEIIRLRWKYLEEANLPAAAEIARLSAWLVYREADVQMAAVQPGRAALMMMDAQSYLEMWWQWAQTPMNTNTFFHVGDDWSRLQDDFEDIARRIQTAQVYLEKQVQSKDPDQGHFLMMAGLRLLEAAERLDKRGYPNYTHHVLHYDGEAAFKGAAAAFRRFQDPENAAAADDMLKCAQTLHDKAHVDMYRSKDPIVPVAEDGQGILLPPALILRQHMAQATSLMGLDPADPSEILRTFDDGSYKDRETFLRSFAWAVRTVYGLEGDAPAALRLTAFTTVLRCAQEMEAATFYQAAGWPDYLRPAFKTFATDFRQGTFPSLSMLQSSRALSELAGMIKATLDVVAARLDAEGVSTRSAAQERRKQLLRQMELAKELERENALAEARVLLVGAESLAISREDSGETGWTRLTARAVNEHKAFHQRHPHVGH